MFLTTLSKKYIDKCMNTSNVGKILVCQFVLIITNNQSSDLVESKFL